MTTSKQNNAMTPEAQRIAIAEACGWIYPGSTCLKRESWGNWIPPKGCTGKSRKVPDYLADLNAMAEAEKVLSDEQYTEYEDVMWDLVTQESFAKHPLGTRIRLSSPTATQRAESFLRTLGKWEEAA